MLVSLVSLLPILTIVRGYPGHAATLSLHERRDDVPHGFQARAVDNSATLHFSIAVAQKNMTGLKAILNDISDYSSPRYGQWLTKDQVDAHVRPAPEVIKAVSDWVSSHGLKPTASDAFGDYITFSATVDQANSMLAANYGNYTHTVSRRSYIRTLAYSIPAHLKEHIDYVYPGIDFTPPPERVGELADFSASLINPRTSCSTNNMMPSCVQELYGIPTTVKNRTLSSVGIGNINGHPYHTDDITAFMAAYRADNPSTTLVNILLAGATFDQSGAADNEADLDVEYTAGFVNNLDTVDYIVGNQLTTGSRYIEVFNHIATAVKRPTALTVSYSTNENDVSGAALQRVCDSAASLTAMGVSIIFASGDQGTGGANDTFTPECAAYPKFRIDFPGTCPYITSVGATKMNPETAESLSGGGFSRYFNRASTAAWQDAQVNAYLSQQDSKYAPFQNSTGRAVPDIAAIQRGPVYVGGQLKTLYGTSMSAPIFASIITLLNNELLAAGKPVLGYLNPRLYGDLAGTFTDITTGATKNGCGTGGYAAVAGWDPTTGLGTPNYNKLRAAVGLA